ncbi:MAG: ribosome silencing factor, partial [Methylotenera sp.]
MTSTPPNIASNPDNLEAMKLAVIDAIEDIKGFDISVMDVRK